MMTTTKTHENFILLSLDRASREWVYLGKFTSVPEITHWISKNVIRPKRKTKSVFKFRAEHAVTPWLRMEV